MRVLLCHGKEVWQQIGLVTARAESSCLKLWAENWHGFWNLQDYLQQGHTSWAFPKCHQLVTKQPNASYYGRRGCGGVCVGGQMDIWFKLPQLYIRFYPNGHFVCSQHPLVGSSEILKYCSVTESTIVWLTCFCFFLYFKFFCLFY